MKLADLHHEVVALLQDIEQAWLRRVPEGPPPDNFPNWHRLRELLDALQRQ
jgi:hypothetical protein